MLDDTIAAIHKAGHREFVGGDGAFWEQISKLQFDFLLSHGLEPTDTFVDIGCGSLRGGRQFIKSLGPGNYHGIDKHIELIIYGVNTELGMDMYRQQMPRFVVSELFEFEKFGTHFTFGIAQSLFTHLNAEDIATCLSRLFLTAAPGCKVFSTFFEVAAPRGNPRHSHSHAGFGYTRSEMETFGRISGWESHYIGEWGHPRGQNMVAYVKPSQT